MAIAACTTDDAIEQIENVSWGACLLCLRWQGRSQAHAASGVSFPGWCASGWRHRAARSTCPWQGCIGCSNTFRLCPLPQVGHDFFLFRDSEDGDKLKVLYRRK